MNKTTIITGILATLAIAGLLFWGRTNGAFTGPQSGISSGAAVLTAEKNFYDFGVISMKNGVVSATFNVSNKTSADVLVTDIVTSCMCTAAYVVGEGEKIGPFGMPGHASIPSLRETVAPGEEFEIEAIFDPNAHGPAGVGPIERVVILEYGGGTLELGFKATVTP